MSHTLTAIVTQLNCSEQGAKSALTRCGIPGAVSFSFSIPTRLFFQGRRRRACGGERGFGEGGAASLRRRCALSHLQRDVERRFHLILPHTPSPSRNTAHKSCRLARDVIAKIKMLPKLKPRKGAFATVLWL
jgi:hypothetical protein